MNYCLSCHSASDMRYNRLTDLGLSAAQIIEDLMFATNKPGNTATVVLSPVEAKEWFGAAPADLTVIARSRGPDWLYTYLRGFYRDDSRPLGWNNTVFDRVGMPHAMQDLQGHMVPVYRMEVDAEGKPHAVIDRLVLAKPGKLTPAEFDQAVADLVNYMAWMGEPTKLRRQTIGVAVLLFLGLFFIVAFYLKKEFWKDVH